MDEPLNTTEVEKGHDMPAESAGVGPIVGTIIVVVLIALGGLYFFIKQFIILK
jgi:hypothetical protein